MASLPPIVQWWDENESAQQSLWDAGVVDAGSDSVPTVFHVWNNRGNSTAVSDMINVDITVRDINGQTADLRVAGQSEAIVYVQFFDNSKLSGIGQWGAHAPSNGQWTGDYWRALKHDEPAPVVSCSGQYRKISGAANTANKNVDKVNYAKIKLKLYAKPAAGAGQIDWLTRISYQYQ